MPTLEEINHAFLRAKHFSKLDAKAGYWSVQLEEQSQLLTTFRTPIGRYCYQRLPFGLCVSQDIFQQRMDVIFGVPGRVCWIRRRHLHLRGHAGRARSTAHRSHGSSKVSRTCVQLHKVLNQPKLNVVLRQCVQCCRDWARSN